MTPENDNKPWARRANESARAYEAFKVYLEMSPLTRTFQKSFYLAYPDSKRISGSWIRWYREHEWTQRATAYDYYNNKLELEAESKARADEAEKWARRRLETAEVEWELGEALHKRAKEMLAFKIAEQERVTSVYDDGRPRETIILRPVKWTLQTVNKFAEVGSVLKRRATDMVIDKIGFVPASATSNAPASVTDEMLAAAVQAFREERPKYADFPKDELITIIAESYGVSRERIADAVQDEE